MKLFNLTFFGPVNGTEELFFRGDSAADSKLNRLRLRQNATVSFDTHFNLLSHTKYVKYCGIRNVMLRLHCRGNFYVNFYHKSPKNENSLFYSTRFTDELEATLNIGSLPQTGYVYFTLTALTEGEIYGGDYSTDTEPRNNVKLGVVICTYKREEFVHKNLRVFCEGIAADPAFAERLHVFVIDNARTLQLPENPAYTVVPNRNLGGSGGFTRGIVEVCKDPSFSHFLLMDDDIRFSFETVKKTIYLLEALLPEYKSSAIGGSMIFLEAPTLQHENGAYFTGVQCLSGNTALDIADPQNLLLNEDTPKANYTAWWYACMPTSTAAEHGLPLPLFIKSDDVEYGIRSIDNLILLNGVSVWHQDFDLKYNATLEYYNRRNGLITTSIHFNTNRWVFCIKLMYAVFVQLTMKRYFCAELVLKAYQDFFAGCDFLKKTDPEKLNEELLRHQPRFIPKEELEQTYRISFDAVRESLRPKTRKRSLMRRALLTIENFLPAFFFKNKIGIGNMKGNWAKPMFLKKTCIHYDYATECGYVCKLDTARRRKIRSASFRVFFNLLFRFGKIKRHYRKNYLSTCTLEEWNNKFFPPEQK